jgi:hypothetical protein
MTSYLKTIVPAAVAVAALLATPVLAKTAHRHAAPSQTPAEGHASTAQPAPHTFVTPYGADLPQQPHTSAVNPDFQVPGKY